MQVTEINVAGLKRELQIVIPASHIATTLDARLKEISRDVRLPGFRPGKVPMSLIKQRFGSSVMGEVLERSVQEGTQNAIAERALRPAGQPQVEITSFNEGADLEYKVTVEVLPDIEAFDAAKITLERLVSEVPDSEIEAALGRIADSRKTPVVVEEARPAVLGDTLEIDFVGSIDGVEFPGGKGEGYDLELGSGSFIPGFEDQLVGASAGDAVTVTVHFPEDYQARDLAGKQAAFAVTVKALKTADRPVVDDAFALSLGLESLEALKTDVKARIGADYVSASRAKMKRELLDRLADAVDFDVPDSMVDAEFEGIWQQLEQAIKNDSLDDDDKGKSEDDLKTEYKALAVRRVRLGLLLADIGQRHEVQVTEEDLNKAVIAEAMKYPQQARQVFDYFQKNQEAVNALRAPIFEDKVVDLLFTLATVSERTVTPEELLTETEAATA